MVKFMQKRPIILHKIAFVVTAFSRDQVDITNLQPTVPKGKKSKQQTIKRRLWLYCWDQIKVSIYPDH